MARKGTGVTEAQIIKALELSQGFISHAARKLNISHQALGQRIKKSKKIRDALFAIKESHLDFSESKLLELIKGVKVEKKLSDGSKIEFYKKPPDLGAVCFHLKCKGKDRGYIERQEVTGKDGEPLKTVEVKIIEPKNENPTS